MSKLACVVLSFVFVCPFVLHSGEARALLGGRLEIVSPDCLFTPTACLPGWARKTAADDCVQQPDGSYPFTLKAGADLNGSARFAPDGRGGIEAAYDVTPAGDTKLENLCIFAQLDGATFFGGAVIGDGKRVALPVERKDTIVFNGAVTKLTLVPAAGGRALELSFPSPVYVMLQDFRFFRAPFFALYLTFGGSGTFKAGQTYRMRFTVAVPPEPLALDRTGRVTLHAGTDWVPVVDRPEILPGSALDFSSISGPRVPAGSYGRVVARGPHFEFERKPGVPQRFYGVNLCQAANFMSREGSETLARRLARLGYNAVRLHHYDGGLTQDSPDGTALNPGQLERFDDWFAALIANGLYVTTDLYVSRPVPYRACGIDRPGVMPMDEFKMRVQYQEGAFSNLLAFGRALLGHVNPRTGRRYADEPALAFLSLVNEGNPGNMGYSFYREMPECVAAWKRWLAAKRAADPAFASVPEAMPGDPGAKPSMAAFALFLADGERRFDERVRDFVRGEMHCRALLSNMSAWENPVCYQLPRAAFDEYVDDHYYVSHPQFLGGAWSVPSNYDSRNPVRDGTMGTEPSVFRRLLDRPFTVTEYNYCGPDCYRGIGGILAGAQGALQDWSGLWRFAWSHQGEVALAPTRMGYFDMAGDPLSLASERASICLFLRRDLAPLGRTCAVVLPPAVLGSDLGAVRPNRADWSWMAWYAKLGTIVTDAAPASATWSCVYPEAYERKEAAWRGLLGPAPQAGDGAVALDAAAGAFRVATPRTCGGFAERGEICAGVLTASISGSAATVWASSLDGAPLAVSRRLLLTHLTDVQNDGAVYADAHLRIFLDWGRLPHLMRAGRAEIALALDPAASYAVYALAADGARRRAVSASCENGRLRFVADIAADSADATYLYEIVRVPRPTGARSR